MMRINQGCDLRRHIYDSPDHQNKINVRGLDKTVKKKRVRAILEPRDLTEVESKVDVLMSSQFLV